MKLLVLGASGRSGRYVVAEALRRGHTVTALVRVSSRTGAIEGAEVMTGDVLHPAAVDAAVRGQDALISVLGPGAGEDPHELSRGLERVMVAMRQHRIDRFVGVTRAGLQLGQDRRAYTGTIADRFYRVRHRADYEAKRDQADLLRRSGIGWTLARPPRLVSGRPSGAYVATLELPAGEHLHREDLARFILDEVQRPQYLQQAPFVISGGVQQERR